MRSETQPADAVHPNVVVISAHAPNPKIYAQLATSPGRRVKAHSFIGTGNAICWLDRYWTGLVTSDEHVFGLDRTDIVRQLSDLGANALVPVVVTPARDWLAQQQLLEDGAIDVWRSPLDLPGCRARVRNLLRVAGDASRCDAHVRGIGE